GTSLSDEEADISRAFWLCVEGPEARQALHRCNAGGGRRQQTIAALRKQRVTEMRCQQRFSLEDYFQWGQGSGCWKERVSLQSGRWNKRKHSNELEKVLHSRRKDHRPQE
ncbi:hypothetical protein V3C99_017856, partial [Haemonchus contortus]